MTRRFYVVATGAAAISFTTAFAAVAFIGPAPRFLWNASASAPIGLYTLQPIRNPRRSTLVAVRPPQPLATWLAERKYLPIGVPLLKQIVATAGQRVCRIGMRLSVDGRYLASAERRDSRGRRLPVWSGCRTLRAGDLMLLNAAVPDSLDGRYFGPLPAAAVIGRAIPIFIRPAADERFHLVWPHRTSPAGTAR